MDMGNLSRRTFVTGLASLALAGCSGQAAEEPEQAQDDIAEDAADTTEPEVVDDTLDESTEPEGGKSLVVVWSWSGNSMLMAERVSQLSGAEIWRIEAADPYPEDYDETADRAKTEQDNGVYPEIANPVENWESYDTIFLGYPIWWYELPMIVQGFVNDHDWTGKTIVPFNSHEGSRDGGTYDDLREMTGATVLDGIAIRGGDVPGSLDLIDEWYAGLNL